MLAALKEEIAVPETSIKDLDMFVTEATEQRKAEHKEFLELMASNTAAKELLNFAKNRLIQSQPLRATNPFTKVDVWPVEL